MARQVLITLVLTVAAAGCEQSYDQLEGMATYALTDESGDVTTVGVQITTASLDALQEHAMAVAAFPEDAVTQTYVNHAQVMFEPHGHDPTGVGEVPHIDVHYHGISIEEREAIDCSEEPVPDEESLPYGYVVEGSGQTPWFGTCVPGMGVHAANKDAPGQNPDNKHQLTAVLEYGYHDGELSFIMPMLHHAVIKEREAVELEVTRPDVLGRVTRWPTRFFATHDEEVGVIRFELTDFSPIQ